MKQSNTKLIKKNCRSDAAYFIFFSNEQGENRANTGRESARKVIKSARGMPRLPEAMKDATSCENPRGGAHTH